jgi:hypothetical protein
MRFSLKFSVVGVSVYDALTYFGCVVLCSFARVCLCARSISWPARKLGSYLVDTYEWDPLSARR